MRSLEPENFRSGFSIGGYGSRVLRSPVSVIEDIQAMREVWYRNSFITPSSLMQAFDSYLLQIVTDLEADVDEIIDSRSNRNGTAAQPKTEKDKKRNPRWLRAEEGHRALIDQLRSTIGLDLRV